MMDARLFARVFRAAAQGADPYAPIQISQQQIGSQQGNYMMGISMPGTITTSSVLYSIAAVFDEIAEIELQETMSKLETIKP